uniref:PERQ amino acid-rich with GYF domain-containing protein CG11148 n=2 Tax=Cacopsylla melanoneura TaxID=428564 RepID=A0A8D8Y5Y0_9HEMI
MAESMKFGPEWLRNMSQDGNPSAGPAPPITSSGPKYQLADYRYGREEMLALYDEQGVFNSPAVLALANIDPMLHSETVQTPVSFIPMSEEETRIYNRGFNSRGFSNPSLGSDPVSGGGGKPFNKMNTAPLLLTSPQSANNNSFRNRNAGIERGRGRGAPGGAYHTRPGIGKDGTEIYNNTMNRNRFGVNAELQSSRGWTDRNGILDDSKKEGQGMHNRQQHGLGGASEGNWRRFREDDEPWRPNFNRTNSTGNTAEKWGGRGSWRQQAEQNVRDRDDDKWDKERGNNSKWGDENKSQNHQQNQYSSNQNQQNSNNGSNGVSRLRRYSFNEDNLPEWATENLSETRGGTFDSNGAYHGMYSDEENENPRRNRNHDNTPNSAHYDNSMSPTPQYGSDSPSKHFENISPTRNLDNASPMKPPPVKLSDDANSGYKESSQDKGPEMQHPQHQHSKTSSPSHKNSTVLESNHRLDSNELMNQRLSKVVDDIDRLITEEEHKESNQPTSNGIDTNIKDKWLYKDPQGSVQGPFTSAEMAEWYRSGYFRSNLLVRRLCDEQFSPLGDLFHFYGNIPFLADTSFPAIKASDHIASQNTKPLDEALLIQQFRDVQYKRAVHSQQQQLFNTVLNNLKQNENWSKMSPAEQQNMISQHMNRILHTTNMNTAVLINQPTSAPINIPPSNPIMQLVAEMTRQDPHFPTPHAPSQPPPHAPQHRPDPPSHLESPHLNHAPHPDNKPSPGPHVPLDHAAPQNNSVQMFLRQVLAAQQSASMPSPQQMSQMMGPPQPPPQQQPHQNMQGGHIWGGAPNEKEFMPRLDSNYFPQHMGGVPDQNSVPGQTQFDQFVRMLIRNDPNSTENIQPPPRPESKPGPQAQPEPAKPAQVPQPEPSKPVDQHPAKLSAAEEKAKKKKQQEEREQAEAEAKKEREKEEALQKQQEEEKQRKKEEEKRKKAEEQKRKKEEKEKQKKLEEEKRKKVEEESRLLEEQKKKEKEEKRKLEQQRQEEALRKLEQQQLKEKTSNKTWSNSTVTQPTIAQPTLADIQKIEKEQKQQLKQQQQQQQQTKKQQKAQQQTTTGENKTNNNKKSENSKQNKENAAALKLGWTSQKPVPVKTKTIAEIQAEQAEMLAKQLEKEKQERLANPQAQVNVVRNKTQFWGSAASMSTPNYAQASAKPVVPSKVNHVKQPSAIITQSSSGFWDEPVKILSNPPFASKQNSNKNTSSSNKTTSSSNVNSSNNKAKKEEIKIKEIFTTSALKESTSSEIKFINWCTNSLDSMKINDLDIPTFIGFLKEIESPRDVKDYVKLYIGEGKQAINFANQYLEKRQACNEPDNVNFNSAIKANNQQSKSKANSETTKKTTEFVEVKGKNKKNKKGKMRHIDTTLLGFSVTAPPDRFNVGERELPE